jgi:hypothetical protein
MAINGHRLEQVRQDTGGEMARKPLHALDPSFKEILELRIEPELLRAIREKAETLNVQVSTLARWCVATGLFLFDLNSFVRSRSSDEEF